MKAIPMKTIRSLILTVAVVATGATANNSFAAEKLSDEDLRKEVQELRALPPEERRVKQRELMEKVSPELREKLRERRQNVRPGGPAGGTNAPVVTPEQRAARMKQAEEMIGKRMADLEKKQADGTITDQEKQQFTRAKQAQERLKNGQAPLLGQAQADMTPAQREARTKTMREMAAKRLAELEKKKTEETLSPAEETRLERLRTMQSRQKAAPADAPKSK